MNIYVVTCTSQHNAQVRSVVVRADTAIQAQGYAKQVWWTYDYFGVTLISADDRRPGVLVSL